MSGPETLHGDPVLDAMAEREQKAAVKAATMVTRTLRALGFDLVIVRVVKLLTHNGECAAPGATAFDSDDRMAPCLPREADGLRLLADDLEEQFRRSGAREAPQGYSEDATHRQAEFEEPKP